MPLFIFILETVTDNPPNKYFLCICVLICHYCLMCISLVKLVKFSFPVLFFIFATGFLADVNSRSRSLYAMADPSVCRLSVVCDVGAPYSAG